MSSICTFETLNEIVHFRAVTLSTVLSTMSFKTIRLVQTIKMHSTSKVFFFYVRKTKTDISFDIWTLQKSSVRDAMEEYLKPER